MKTNKFIRVHLKGDFRLVNQLDKNTYCLGCALEMMENGGDNRNNGIFGYPAKID